jgi:hypothetical protein
MSPIAPGFSANNDRPRPAVDEQQTFVSERRRDRRHRHSTQSPQFLAVEVVTNGSGRSHSDDLGALRMSPDKRRGPTGALYRRLPATEIAFRAPQLLAGLLVETGDVLLLLVVGQNHEEIAGQCRRASGSQFEINRI